MNIKNIEYCFNNDIIPDCFNYTLTKESNIDYCKLQYNDYYKSFEFVASKFPKGWESFPNFDLVINDIANNIKLTPLEEINLKPNT